MNKKAVAILGAIFILIAGTLGFLIYTKYGNRQKNESGATAKNEQKEPPPPSEPPLEPLPEPEPEPAPPDVGGAAKIVKLADEQIISPALFYDGTGISFFDQQGQLYQANLEDIGGTLQLSKKRSLEITPKAGIGRILWPAQGDNFIAEVSSLGKKNWSFYDSKLGVYTNLPPEVFSFDWAPDGQKIYYVWLENGKASLNVSDPDTKNWKKIDDMWEADNQLKVSPDGLNILYYQTNNASTTNSIKQTTPDGKIWLTLVKDGYNFGALWSPDSQKFIFAKKDPATQQYFLWLYNFFSGEIKNLRLPTIVDKIVWDKNSKTIYAAVPQSGLAGEDTLTEDNFVKMDTDSLEKTEYNSGGAKVDGRDLFLNKAADKLFFKNAQDGGLYYLDLK